MMQWFLCVSVGPMLGQCWAFGGPSASWAHVGSFGVYVGCMLGIFDPCWALGGYVGPMLDHVGLLGPMLSAH